VQTLFLDPPRLRGGSTHPSCSTRASGGRGTTFARTARGHKCRFGLRRAKKGPKRASNGPRWGSSGCPPHGRSWGPPARVLMRGLRGTRLCRRSLYRGDTDHVLGLSSASVSHMYLFTRKHPTDPPKGIQKKSKNKEWAHEPKGSGSAYVPSSSHIHHLCAYVTVDARLTR